MYNYEDVEIALHNDVGFKRLIEFNSWSVAILNYKDKFDEKNIAYLEKHTETDEVFVLLEGKATLLVGEDMKKIPMSNGVIYNVRKNKWHNIILESDSKVLIVENSDTNADNTEYLYLDDIR